MALIFPTPSQAALQTPVNTFSPTSTPLFNTSNGYTYTFIPSKGVWVIGSTGGVASIAVSSPLTSTGGQNPTVGIGAASTSSPGAVQLNDTTSSTSTSQAATANAVRQAASLATSAIPCACITAKGAILTGTASSAPVALPVGSNGQVLIACSTSATGLCWGSLGGGTVTSISTGTGLTGGTITTTGTISLGNTSVTAGSYTYGAFTVDAQGRLTAASSGTSPSTTVTSPVTNTGTAIQPVLGVLSASTTQCGVVQLNDTVTSTSVAQAATANSVKVTYDLASGAVPCSSFTASGDLLVGAATGSYSALPVGVNGSVLTVNSACTSGMEWAPVSSGTVSSITAGTGLSGGTITATGTISLDTAYTDGLYLKLSGGTLTGPLTVEGAISSDTVTTTGDLQIERAGSTVGLITETGSYLNDLEIAGISYPTSDGTAGQVVCTNGSGTLGWATPSSGTVTSVVAGTALSGGTITSSGTISLADTAVTPGNYTYGSFTVDQQGRVTNASDGAAPNTTVSSPITNTGTAIAPVIGIQTATTGQLGAVQVGTNIDVSSGVISVANASTTGVGVVQLNDSVASNSTAEALTANQGLILQTQIDALLVAGGLILAGTYDGSTGFMATVTSSGSAAGFTVGSPYPAAATGNTDYFVIVTTAGGGAISGDWYLSNGTSWELLSVGTSLPVATTSTAGIVELATDAETQTGTDTSTAVTPAAAAATYIPLTALSSKGAIVSASGANVAATVTVGTDGQVLTADSTCTAGLKWTTPFTLKAFTCANNSAIGCCAGAAICAGSGPVGSNNTLAGLNAGCAITSGSGNTHIGACSGTAMATSSNSTLLGFKAGATSSTLISDTYIGACAGMDASGYENTYVGLLSGGGGANTGNGGTFIGALSGCCVTSGSSNTFIGVSTGRCTTTGSDNVAIGSETGCAISTGSNNVLIGPSVQAFSPTGSCQLAIGFNDAEYWITGDSSKNLQFYGGIKDCAGNLGTAGQLLRSTGSAIEWVTAVTTPATPTSAGVVVGCTTASLTALGCNVGVCGTNNTFIGCNSGKNATSNNNVAIGSNAIGIGAGGCCSVAIGVNAMANQGTDGSNVVIGYNAACGRTAGYFNVVIGECANATAGATAINNVIIGGRSGPGAGSNNTFVGTGSGPLTNTLHDGSIFVGVNAGQGYISCGCQIVIGNNSGANGGGVGFKNVIIGHNMVGAYSNLALIGQGGGTCAYFNLGVAFGWTFASDGRIKDGVTALPANAEEFINDLRPVAYCYLDRKTKQPLAKKHCNVGFIAQEVEAAMEAHGLTEITSLVEKPETDDDYYGLSNESFTPFLVKAIQELSAKNKELENRIAKLEG